MRLLYDLRNDMDTPTGSPLELWIKKHGKRTIDKFKKLKEDNNFIGPVSYKLSPGAGRQDVYIDPDHNHNMVDKLSQVTN